MREEPLSLRKIIDTIPETTPGWTELSAEHSLVSMEQREIDAFVKEAHDTIPDEDERDVAIGNFVDRILKRTIDASDINFPPNS
jgi:hypothetical protein